MSKPDYRNLENSKNAEAMGKLEELWHQLEQGELDVFDIITSHADDKFSIEVTYTKRKIEKS